jgi:hypothetical protein
VVARLASATLGGGRGCGDDRLNFFFGHDALGLFCSGEYAVHHLIAGGDAALFEPEDYV